MLEIQRIEQGVIGPGKILDGGAGGCAIIGTVSATTARNRPGRNRAACHAIVAPIMADVDRLLLPKHIKVADRVKDRVLIRVLRRIGTAITSQIRRNRTVTSLFECAYLVSPGVFGFGEAVAEQDQWTLTGITDAHVDRASLHHFLFHGRLLTWWQGDRRRADKLHA
ncbi:hypothetical protein ABID21_004939 [Pseudorhizobium tarimense]|uniref:Uncharacterized protein n=1 Tax=Pseudorhizobium tarimense TaxID=1079109 RepID=A0ABV2HE49_9HYPH